MEATVAAVYIGRHRGRSEHRAEAAEHIVDSRHTSILNSLSVLIVDRFLWRFCAGATGA